MRTAKIEIEINDDRLHMSVSGIRRDILVDFFKELVSHLENPKDETITVHLN